MKTGVIQGLTSINKSDYKKKGATGAVGRWGNGRRGHMGRGEEG